jgi:pimeloyl-ACP methyl ester carboxylesterase
MGEWPQDVIELADAFDIPKFVAVGASGGGPYAASCALKIPERLIAVGILCGLGQTDLPRATDGMTLMNRFGLRIGKHAPGMLKLLFSLSAILLRYYPELVVQIISHHLKGRDRGVIRQPEVRRTLKASFRESMNHGPSGAIQDLYLYSHPWDFRLQDIEMEVYLWHGMRDTIVPYTMGLKMKKSIPRCRATFCPDEGHFSLLYYHMRHILTVLTRQPQAA